MKALRADDAVGMVPEVRMRDRAHTKLASLAQTRDRLVKLRTALMNKIHNLWSAQGILLQRESLGTLKGLEDALKTPVCEVAAIALKALGKEIRSLNENIAERGRTYRDTGISEASKGLGTRAPRSC